VQADLSVPEVLERSKTRTKRTYRIREAIMLTPVAPLRHTATFLLVAVGTALIAGAPSATMAQSAGGAAISVKATELEPSPNPSLAYNRMADAMGLFASHGLTLELGPSLGGGGPARVQAVVTNNTEVATSDIISVLGGIYSGAKIKILMVMTPYGDEEVWGQNKYKTLKDAEGQTWGVASLAGAERFNDQMAIEGMGFKADAFRWVAISGADGTRLQAAVTGRTQLASLSHLGAALAEAKGFAGQVHAIVTHTAKYTPPVPRLVVVAGSDWIKTHQAAATRYVEMMLDASRQWQNDAKAWVAPAEKIYKNSGMTDAQLQAVWGEFRDGGYFSVNGGVNFAATQKVMDMFFKLRSESPNQYLAKPSDVYETGPLKAALDKIGVAKGTPNLPDIPDWYKAKNGHAG
jgi:ABC-type nitrate/sulfonate/bicarbonate transport system substrate-binding protein